MNDHRNTQLEALREQVARGEYVVDPRAVADSILWRIQGIDTAPELPAAPPPARSSANRMLRRERGSRHVARPRTDALAA